MFKFNPLISRDDLGITEKNGITVRKDPRLLNHLPAYIWNTVRRLRYVFRKELDSFLQDIPDQPGSNTAVEVEEPRNHPKIDVR